MDPRILAAIILLAVSLGVLLIGYLIGARKRLSLIAGLDASQVRGSDGLAHWVGTGLLGIGVLDLLICLALFAISAHPTLIVSYALASLVGAVVLLINMRRYPS